MRIPLQDYLTKKQDNLEVFSYIIEVPFMPLDFDVGRLMREFGWDNKVDRFRIWNLPKMRGRTERNYPYLIFKKLDRQQDVLLFGRVDFSPYGERTPSRMAVSMLCNDDEYPDKFLSLFVDQPPAFHSLKEFTVIQKAWVHDEDALSHFEPHLAEPAVAKEALSGMSTKQERRILEFMAKNGYYPVSGENMKPLKGKPKVAVQVATETPYLELRLTFEVERSRVAEELNKILKDFHKINLPKMDKSKGEISLQI